MEKQKFIIAFCFLLSSFLRGCQGGATGEPQPTVNDQHGFEPKMMFVFGDSYADTGNNEVKDMSWKIPYGLTFPGKPKGRFSDGLILTDYIARFLGLTTPVAYRQRQSTMDQLKNGMNFAYGGTGVFQTLVSDPNMTVQIDYFQTLLQHGVYKKQDLESSLAVVTLSGTDYTTYLAHGGTSKDMRKFTIRMITQLSTNLKRIANMGVKKIAVTAIEPMGCLPIATSKNSFQHCESNEVAKFHNQLIEQGVAKLNKETKGSPFVILDLYNSFLTVLENKATATGTPKFATPLKPCCMGINSKSTCGSVDKNNKPMYTICADRDAAFFWDLVHPSQAGWNAVYLSMRPTLRKIIS